jgi:hypothetical protein
MPGRCWPEGAHAVPNEPDALVIADHLREQREAGAQIAVADIRGETIALLKGPSEAGLNRR